MSDAELDDTEKRLRMRSIALRGVGGTVNRDHFKKMLRAKDATLDDEAADAIATLRRERDEARERWQTVYANLKEAREKARVLRLERDEARKSEKLRSYMARFSNRIARQAEVSKGNILDVHPRTVPEVPTVAEIALPHFTDIAREMMVFLVSKKDENND